MQNCNKLKSHWLYKQVISEWQEWINDSRTGPRTFQGNRVFADVIESGVLRWGHSPGLNAITGILIREAEEELMHIQKRRKAMCSWRPRLEWWGHKPRNASSRQETEESRGRVFLSGASRGNTSLARTLILSQCNWFHTYGLRNSERRNACCVSHQVGGNLLDQPRETNTCRNWQKTKKRLNRVTSTTLFLGFLLG